ncbi:MAG: hypothetical protein POH28_05650 [Acidocella sp.]|nr:hypothetical protein [Acidocella sp.]
MNFVRRCHWQAALVGLGGVPLVLMLSGCAGHTLPLPTAQSSGLTGPMVTARVSAVRMVSLAPGNDGLDAVLAALGQPPPAAPVTGQDVVMRRADGSAVSLMQPAQPVISTGQNVTIIQAATTVLHVE